MDAFDDVHAPRAGGTWYHAPQSRTRTSRTDRVFLGRVRAARILPIYSGGLGILAGDHCKTASDLGLPFVGVGFLYPQGYFQQQIDADGRQQAIYEKLDFAEVPAQPALNGKGEQVAISVDLPGRTSLRQGVAHPGGPHPASI